MWIFESCIGHNPKGVIHFFFVGFIVRPAISIPGECAGLKSEGLEPSDDRTMTYCPSISKDFRIQFHRDASGQPVLEKSRFRVINYT
jgi:hypothetical protein